MDSTPKTLNSPALYEVIYQLFDRASVNYYLVGVDRLFYSAVYEAHPEVARNPINTFYLREMLVELVKTLEESMEKVGGTHAQYKYKPKLLRKIMKYEKWRNKKVLRGRRYSEHYAPWEYIPRHLSDKEFRKPRVALRYCLARLKDLEYEELLQELQDSAFSGPFERWMDGLPEHFQLYRMLKKMLEACYLIFAGEMDYSKPAEPA